MENNSETEKKSGMSPALLGIGAIIIIALAGFLFLSKSGKKENNEKTAATTVKEETVTAAPTEALPSTAKKPNSVTDKKTVTVDMEAGSFYYEPNVLKIKKGQKVKLTLKSVDMMHDFNIDELGVKVPVTKSGSEATVEFTPTKTGTFEYYCSVGKHRSLGQVGKITVE